MNRIIRNKYLKELIDISGTPDIKVITGVGRSGKSVLLQQFADYLRDTEKDVNIISANLQELEYYYLVEYHKLHSYVMDNYKPNAHNVVMIDEIQLCDKFELAVNSLHTKGLFDIYLILVKKSLNKSLHIALY